MGKVSHAKSQRELQLEKLVDQAYAQLHRLRESKKGKLVTQPISGRLYADYFILYVIYIRLHSQNGDRNAVYVVSL